MTLAETTDRMRLVGVFYSALCAQNAAAAAADDDDDDVSDASGAQHIIMSSRFTKSPPSMAQRRHTIYIVRLT